MLALHQRHEPIDTFTVSDQLTRQGVLERAGGSLAVDELAGWVPAAGHARSYARIVRDLAARRSVLRACYEIQQHALEGHGSVDELLADATKRVGELLDHSLAGGSRHMHEICSTAPPNYTASQKTASRRSECPPPRPAPHRANGGGLTPKEVTLRCVQTVTHTPPTMHPSTA